MTLLLLVFTMVSYGEKLTSLPGLFKPHFIIMDNQQFYVCDGAVVSIYSQNDFSLKTKFGKEGEGPGEFKLNPNKEELYLYPQTDYLLINSIGKVSFFTKDGKFIKELRTESVTISGHYKSIANKFVGIDMNRGSDLSMLFTINLLDSQFKKTKEIYKETLMKRGSMFFPMVFPLFSVEDNKIIVPGGNEFSLNILDSSLTV